MLKFPNLLDKNGYPLYQLELFTKQSVQIFRILKDFDYDILVFYSPSGIKSSERKFSRSFKQGDIKIAAFGPTTAYAVEQEGLRLDINAPNPKAPSMTMALDDFLKEYNRNLR